jgi:hypothetical protein
MKSIKVVVLSGFLFLFSLSCAFLSQPLTGGSGGGPKGFTAETSPYGSVKLSWEPVEGAQSYQLESQLDGTDSFIPVIELSADQTSYEDYLAPNESKLTYRLQAITDGKPGGYSTASVTTPAIQPNPLTVQATFAEDQVVTKSIGPEGGSMSLTDQNGVLYELQVPAGAVLAATDFTLTPVSDIQGWPLDGANLGSVRIGPEGLDLYAHLTLTITLPDGFPQDGTLPVGYGFEGSGDEFHIFPAGVATAGTSSLPNGSGIKLISFMAQTKNNKSTQSVNKAGSQGVGTASKGKIIEFVDGHKVTQEGVNIDQLLVAQQAMDDELPALPTHNPSAANAIWQKKEALQMQREMWNVLGGIKNAEKKNKTDCANVTNWYDKTSELLERANESDNFKFIDEANSSHLLSSLNDALTKVITKGISECKNSSPGKPPAGRNCVQKLVSKLQIDSNKSGANSLFSVPKGDFKSTDLYDFQKTLKYSCGLTAYTVMGGKSVPDLICDFEKPFKVTVKVGIDYIYSFTPKGPNSGTVELTTPSIQGTVIKGSGTYDLVPSEEFVTITQKYREVQSCIGGKCFPFPALPNGDIVLKADPTATCPEN